MMFNNEDRILTRKRLRRWFERTFPSRFPDRCQMPGCERHGLRGYEAMINLDGKNMLICEECLVHLRTAESTADLGASWSRPE